jgi:subtilisin-like proprotein convertase family protein
MGSVGLTPEVRERTSPRVRASTHRTHHPCEKGPLNGTPASGAWRLDVVDDNAADIGTFHGWALVLCTTTP